MHEWGGREAVCADHTHLFIGALCIRRKQTTVLGPHAAKRLQRAQQAPPRLEEAANTTQCQHLRKEM